MEIATTCVIPDEEEEEEEKKKKKKAKTRSINKVIAICGSLRKTSMNRGLIRSAIEICEEGIDGMEIEEVEIHLLPFINPDLEMESEVKFPPVVEAFRRRVHEADAFLFAFPEYNYSLPAPLKNAIDWASRPPNVMAGKTAAMVSAAGGSGGNRSQAHLRQIGVFLDLHFINKPEIFIKAHQPPKKFDSDGNLVDPHIKENLKSLLLALQSFTLRLHPKLSSSS
ncbi:NAD(P)H dehydrogenase (quinone) protein [Dioscorea alata]|uniref:NAD(P)H dehydrogenase (Quinone) protein n=1 Tax=Dioscorea alata TaxID=55571 RepID=A0ACB7VX92_DIOAL|nr:NAD(P)H dehydrogenase (quinone) protein [Dioscorea alata]